MLQSLMAWRFATGYTHICQDPKDGELCLGRAKSGENQMEARSHIDIDSQVGDKRSAWPSAWRLTHVRTWQEGCAHLATRLRVPCKKHVRTLPQGSAHLVIIMCRPGQHDVRTWQESCAHLARRMCAPCNKDARTLQKGCAYLARRMWAPRHNNVRTWPE